MPIQQQIVIWVLIALAGASGAYSFATGKMFAASTSPKKVAQAEAPYPTIAQDFPLPTTEPKEINIEGAAFIAKEQVCTYSQKDISMKLYSKDSRVRVDATMKGDDPRKAGIIIDKGTSYIWDIEEKQGVKMVDDPTGLLAPDEILNLIATQLGTTPEAFTESCKPQKVAETFFAEPKGIEFSGMDDIGAMTKLIPGIGSLGALGDFF